MMHEQYVALYFPLRCPTADIRIIMLLWVVFRAHIFYKHSYLAVYITREHFKNNEVNRCHCPEVRFVVTSFERQIIN